MRPFGSKTASVLVARFIVGWPHSLRISPASMLGFPVSARMLCVFKVGRGLGVIQCDRPGLAAVRKLRQEDRRLAG